MTPVSCSALSFSSVSFAYGATPVLSDINLTIPPGEVTALMGPSGSGKSTVLAIAAGLLEPTSGDVQRNCQRPAMVFQDPLLLPWRTALDNVSFALKAEHLHSAKRCARALEVLESVGLGGEDASKFPHQLSGGMRQRTALARALVTQPDLLLLDEPFGALDAELAQQMHRLVLNYVEKHSATALLVTHDLNEARTVANYIGHLTAAPGRMASFEPAQDTEKVLERQTLQLV